MPYGLDFRLYTDKGCPLPLGGKVRDKKGRIGLVIDRCLANRISDRESYLKVSVRWDNASYKEKKITNVKPSSLTVLEVYKFQVWIVSSNPFYQDKIYFDDAFKTEEEVANSVFGNGRGFAHHNPYSGKYNIHPPVPEGIKPCDRIPYIDKTLDEVRNHFESVMEV